MQNKLGTYLDIKIYLKYKAEEGVKLKNSIEDLSDNALVGTKFAAEYLGCSMQTVRNWIALGEMPNTETTLGGNYRDGNYIIRFKDLKMVKDKMQKSKKIRGDN
nr:hypothetical protein [uncultured Lachnoclostridium sp.]